VIQPYRTGYFNVRLLFRVSKYVVSEVFARVIVIDRKDGLGVVSWDEVRSSCCTRSLESEWRDLKNAN